MNETKSDAVSESKKFRNIPTLSIFFLAGENVCFSISSMTLGNWECVGIVTCIGRAETLAL